PRPAAGDVPAAAAVRRRREPGDRGPSREPRLPGARTVIRVALVIAGPYPAFRGSQVLVAHLALGLHRRGHDVHVVSYGAARGERPGPRPVRLPRDAVLLARLWAVVRRGRIDVLHAHNYEAAIASLVVGRLAGCPAIYHGHRAHADESSE